jgi:hypothetical protein
MEHCYGREMEEQQQQGLELNADAWNTLSMRHKVNRVIFMLHCHLRAC